MKTDPAAAELLDLNTTELLALFTTLPAPSIEEMNGEYAARLLAQPNAFASVTGHAAVSNPFARWLCKGFRPVDGRTGRGYNTFRQFGRIRRRYAMHTLIAPSRYDGRPAYTLVYRAYGSVCGAINMVDEVRRAAPGVYLGIGTWGFTERQRRIPLPFLLTGPVGPYRGDVGTARRGFTPGPRELPGRRETGP